jgi:peptide-methionine (S)-S-oxide reductase
MSEKKVEMAVLGGGCFWCLDAAFRRCIGVSEVVSGYSGGPRPNPTYEQVCTGVSGHAEVVKVTFNPAEISYEDILQVFFSIHDPTTLNRQGHDVGTQYRSVIFYASPEQEAVAKKVIKELTKEKLFDQPIVTEVTALEKFYPAEGYHQQYYEYNPEKAYCQIVIAPKLAKFREKNKRFYKEA